MISVVEHGHKCRMTGSKAQSSVVSTSARVPEHTRTGVRDYNILSRTGARPYRIIRAPEAEGGATVHPVIVYVLPAPFIYLYTPPTSPVTRPCLRQVHREPSPKKERE